MHNNWQHIREKLYQCCSEWYWQSHNPENYIIIIMNIIYIEWVISESIFEIKYLPKVWSKLYKFFQGAICKDDVRDYIFFHTNPLELLVLFQLNTEIKKSVNLEWEIYTLYLTWSFSHCFLQALSSSVIPETLYL